MLSQEAIAVANSLPSSAQHQIETFINFLSQQVSGDNYQVNKSNTDQTTEKKKDITLEDSFGMFTVDHPITLEDMEEAISTLGGQLDSR